MDDTNRGIIHRYFYPIAYVQTFRPCSWTDVRAYICEGEAFRELVTERHRWLVEYKIKCRVDYRSMQEDPEQPNFYRLETGFSCCRDAALYLARWA